MLTCPNPTREIPNTCNKKWKNGGFNNFIPNVSGVLVLFDFFGFPGNNFLEDQTLFFGLGFPHFWRSTAGQKHSCQALSASLLHLLRPNVLVPGQQGAAAIDTPRKIHGWKPKSWRGLWRWFCLFNWVNFRVQPLIFRMVAWLTIRWRHFVFFLKVIEPLIMLKLCPPSRQ